MSGKNNASRNTSISRAAIGGFGHVAPDPSGHARLDWDTQQRIITPTAPPVEFGIVDEPCVWLPPSGPNLGYVCVEIDAVAVEGSECRSLALFYAPEYLQAHGLTDESSLLLHAREAAMQRLCGCTGERARSNGERLLELRFEDGE